MLLKIFRACRGLQLCAVLVLFIFCEGLAELRAIIIKTSGPKKAAVLKAFDQVAARYR